MTAGELCTRRVITALADETAAAAARRMAAEHVGDLIVVEERAGTIQPIGIVTDRDLVRKVMAPGRAADAIALRDVMSAATVVASDGDDVSHVFETVRAHGVRRVPVIGRDGGLIGVLALDDLTEWVAEQLDDVVGALRQNLQRERGARAH